MQCQRRYGTLDSLLCPECFGLAEEAQYNLSIIQLLISSGLTLSHQTLRIFWSQDADAFQQCVGPSFNKVCFDLVNLLASHSQHLLVESPFAYVSYRTLGLESTSTWLLESAFPCYGSRSAVERWSNFNHALQLALDGREPERYLHWLGQHELTASFVQELGPGNCLKMLADIAQNVGWLSTNEGEALGFWQRLLNQAVESGLVESMCIADCTIQPRSPLLEFYEGRFRQCDEETVWKRVRFRLCDEEMLWKRVEVLPELRTWLRMLADAGANLRRYGHLERRILLARYPNTLPVYSPRHPAVRSIGIIGLSFGEKIDDWHLWLHSPLDQWAADFWGLVEPVPEISIPGSWIDEEQEREAARACEERSEHGVFKSLATSHRKRDRYLRYTKLTPADAQKSLGSLWENMISINRKFRSDTQLLWDWPPFDQKQPQEPYYTKLYDSEYVTACAGCGADAEHIVPGLLTGEVDFVCRDCHRQRKELWDQI